MKIIIDTQSVIWFAENNSQLSQIAKATIEDANNDCYVSMATFWEISIKKNLGKLDIKGLLLSELWDEVLDNEFYELNIRREHILENENLILHHRDPFDRLIIAQAIVEKMSIISNDVAFDAYPVIRIW